MVEFRLLGSYCWVLKSINNRFFYDSTSAKRVTHKLSWIITICTGVQTVGMEDSRRLREHLTTRSCGQRKRHLRHQQPRADG